MLYEFKELSCFENLPRRMKYLKYYLLGVADSEGSFNVSIKKQAGTRFGYVLDPIFQVTQHEKNKCVLLLFKRVLNCGRVIKKPSSKNLYLFIVDNRRQLREKVIAFFDKYKPIMKYQEYSLFKEIVLGLEKKQHLSYEGFVHLLKKAYGMNYEGKQRRRDLEKVLNEVKHIAKRKGYL